MTKIEKRLKRKKRVRAKVFGTKKTPRLSVFRSNSHIYAQLIDDEAGNTLVSANDMQSIKEKKSRKDLSFQVGVELAKKALEKKIKKAVFDRNGYRYHGRVKGVADGARKGGLTL